MSAAPANLAQRLKQAIKVAKLPPGLLAEYSVYYPQHEDEVLRAFGELEELTDTPDVEVFVKTVLKGAGTSAGAGAAAGTETAPTEASDQAMLLVQERLARLEARRHTHTDIAGIGREIQRDSSPVDAARLGIRRVSPDTTDLRDDLRSLVEQINTATSEKQLQEPVYKAVKLLADWRQSRLYALDTHEKGYGGIRIQKPDISLSLTPEKLIAQLVAVIELKFELTSSTQQNEVLGQIKERLMYLLEQQPGRQMALGLGMGSSQLVLVKCDRQGHVERTQFLNLGWLDSVDDGWQVLLGFLSAQPYHFGYLDPTVPTAVMLPGGEVLKEYTAVAIRKNVAVYKAAVRIKGQRKNVVLKAGTNSSISYEAGLLALPAVRQCKYLPTLVTTGNLVPKMQGGFDKYLLIKEYGVHITSAAAPAAIIRYIRDAACGLQTLASAGYLHCDISPDNLVVVWDRATDSVLDQPSAYMDTDATDSGQEGGSIEAETSDLSSSEQCSETDSIEAAMESDSGHLKCLVLDLHVAQRCSAVSSLCTLPAEQPMLASSSKHATEQSNAASVSIRPAAVSGKPVFFGLAVHMTCGNSLSADLESLFLCALDIVSDGAAIRWRNAHFSPVHDEMLDIKYSSLLVDFTWETKLLPRCILVELRNWLNQLRQLFYPRATSSAAATPAAAAAPAAGATAAAGRPIVGRGYNDAVTPEEFILLCDQARERLSLPMDH